MARVIAPAFGFTPEQQKQYDKLVPDVPEEAVARILREWSCPGEEADLLQGVHRTRNGVLSFAEEKVGEALRRRRRSGPSSSGCSSARSTRHRRSGGRSGARASA